MKKNLVLEVFDTANARGWQRRSGRKEIKQPHFPIVWLTFGMKTDLDAAIKSGDVELVSLPSRIGSGTSTFVVKVK